MLPTAELMSTTDFERRDAANCRIDVDKFMQFEQYNECLSLTDNSETLLHYVYASYFHPFAQRPSYLASLQLTIKIRDKMIPEIKMHSCNGLCGAFESSVKYFYNKYRNSTS